MVKKIKTAIDITSVIGWGLLISMAVVTFLWSKVTAIDSQYDSFKDTNTIFIERMAKVEKSQEYMQGDISEIKSDVKDIKGLFIK